MKYVEEINDLKAQRRVLNDMLKESNEERDEALEFIGKQTIRAHKAGLRLQELVTEEELNKVWGNANFGSALKRDVIKYGILKRASGYHNGHTCDCILKELGLISEKTKEPTAKGRDYMWSAFGAGTGH